MITNTVEYTEIRSGRADGTDVMRRFAPSLLVLGCIVTLTGCSTPTAHLAQQGRVELIRQGSEKIHIPWATVQENDEGFVVSGTLRRRDSVGTAIWTHVDITVCDTAGAMVRQAYSEPIAVPRRKVGGLGHLTRFRAVFDAPPPKAGSIQVAVCFDTHEPASR